MKHSSAWAAHKAADCAKGCWYCRFYGPVNLLSVPGAREAKDTAASRFQKFKDRLGKLLRSTRGAK